MKKIFVFISPALLLLACGKSRPAPETNQVHVRIENKAGFTLQQAAVTGVNYGDVSNGQLTAYKIITMPVYAGYCQYNIKGVESGAGYGVCGTPMPPPFSPGYYTFKLEPAPDGTYTMLTVTKE